MLGNFTSTNDLYNLSTLIKILKLWIKLWLLSIKNFLLYFISKVGTYKMALKMFTLISEKERISEGPQHNMELFHVFLNSRAFTFRSKNSKQPHLSQRLKWQFKNLLFCQCDSVFVFSLFFFVIWGTGDEIMISETMKVLANCICMYCVWFCN